MDSPFPHIAHKTLIAVSSYIEEYLDLIDHRENRPTSEEIEEARKHVHQGASFLDEKLKGWRDQVDLEIFRIQSCEECILGQLFGSFSSGLTALNGSTGEYSKTDIAIEMGFAAAPVRPEVLTVAWIEELSGETYSP